MMTSRLPYLNLRRREECSTIIRWLDPKPGERILDVGCGTGHFARVIARAGADVVGIDIRSHKLWSRRDRAGRGGQVEFREMDAVTMDLPPASFDKAISLCVIEHLSDDDRTFRNIAGALKPGARFVFSADSLSTPGITDGERARHRKRYAVKSFYTMENMGGKLSQAGFGIERLKPILTTPTATRLVRLSWRLDDLKGALAPLRTLGYVVLGAAWGMLMPFSRRAESRTEPEGGLTLLVHARKGREVGHGELA